MHHRPGLVAGSGQLVAGRYRLAEQIGRGAMGIVWRGRDELLDREVAVKQVRQHPLAAPGESLVSQQRTLREARSAARLSHPNVITIHDVVEDRGGLWIIMELIHARPLDQVIAEDGPLPPGQASRLGEMLLAALVTAHAAGVLHRDVKPGNVLITADGQAVLTDFGIATVEGDPGLTQAGMVAGTPGFAAPERVRGFPATPASDFWSLGATLYAAVEGRGPYERPGGTSAIIAASATDPPPRAPSGGPLAPVIDALLQPDPARRPDRFAAARLLALAAGPAVTSRPGAAGRGPAGTDSPMTADPAPGPESARGASGHDAATAPAPRAAASPGPGAPGLPGQLAPPAFGELSMPAAADGGPGGPGQSSLPPASGHPDAASGPRAIAAAGGVPAAVDVPAAGRGSAAGDVAAAGGAGITAAGASAGSGPTAPGRWRIGIAAAAAAVIVAGALGWLSFAALPGLIGSQGADRLPGAGGDQTGQRPASRSGESGGAAATRPGGGLAAPASPGAKPAGQRSGAPGSGRPAQGGGTGSPGSSGPGKTPSPSSSPSPHPPPPPPPGFYWQTVTGASIGTTAGYRVAVPDGWRLDTLGIATRFSPPSGSFSITVNLTPFAYASPVREARYLQDLLRADLAGNYRLVSLRGVSYRGQPAALWRYLHRVSLLGRTRFAAVGLVTLPTDAGPQPYAVSVSAPASQRVRVSALLSVELAAFSAVG